MNFDMYTMERRLEMTLTVQTNLKTSIGSTWLVTFREHTVNTYIFPLLLPNRGKIHIYCIDARLLLTFLNFATEKHPSVDL
jgi:hypothetical protein